MYKAMKGTYENMNTYLRQVDYLQVIYGISYKPIYLFPNLFFIYNKRKFWTHG